MTAPKISIVIPTLREAATIGAVLEGLGRALQGHSWEALVVDDGSSDGTPEIVARLAEAQPRIRLIRRDGPADLAAAVHAGFTAARGDYLGSMNADGSHDPRYWTALLAALEAGNEVAIASRYAPGGQIGPWPWPRRALSQVSTAVARAALNLTVADPLSGFYAVRREVYERCRDMFLSEGFKVLLELLVRTRSRRVVEVPIAFRDRVAGKSKLSGAVLWRGAVGLARLCGETA